MESVKMIAPETALKQQSSKRHGQQRQLNKLGGGHKAAGHEQGDSKQVKANVSEKSTPKSGGEQKVTVTRATRGSQNHAINSFCRLAPNELGEPVDFLITFLQLN